MKDSLFSLKNLWDRLKSETPKYWKQVRNLMLTLSALATVLVASEHTPANIKEICSYVITVGLVLSFFAQSATTTKYVEQVPEGEERK